MLSGGLEGMKVESTGNINQLNERNNSSGDFIRRMILFMLFHFFEDY
jgi:hypothetical protein